MRRVCVVPGGVYSTLWWILDHLMWFDWPWWFLRQVGLRLSSRGWVQAQPSRSLGGSGVADRRLQGQQVGVWSACMILRNSVALVRWSSAVSTITKWSSSARLETRTKESNIYASIWVWKPEGEMKVKWACWLRCQTCTGCTIDRLFLLVRGLS